MLHKTPSSQSHWSS